MTDIKPNYQHTKFGNFLFNLCAKWTKFVVKHRVLYYIISLTWGLLLTIFGFLVTLALLIGRIFNKNIHFKKYYWIYGISAGPDYWGGFETGLMFVRDQKSTLSVDSHEFGHTFQNTLFGPFQIIWSLTSVVRYWYIDLFFDRKNKTYPKAYDSYWLEDAASQCGKYAIEYIRAKKNKNC